MHNNRDHLTGVEDLCSHLSPRVLELGQIEKEPKKLILDASCGGRMMWVDKHHPNVLYMDIRNAIYVQSGVTIKIEPDVVGDFRNLPDQVKCRNYRLIAWDVPHLLGTKMTGVMTKKYGVLNPETWQQDLQQGFNQLWDVLEPYGVLVVKFKDCVRTHAVIRHNLGVGNQRRRAFHPQRLGQLQQQSLLRGERQRRRIQELRRGLLVHLLIRSSS